MCTVYGSNGDINCNKNARNENTLCSGSRSICQLVLFTHKCLSVHVSRPFLSEQLSQDVAEMLLVVQREVEEDGSWLISDGCENWNLRTGSSLRLFMHNTKCFCNIGQSFAEQHYQRGREHSHVRSHVHTEKPNLMVNVRDISAVKDVFKNKVFRQDTVRCMWHRLLQLHHMPLFFLLLFSFLSG